MTRMAAFGALMRAGINCEMDPEGRANVAAFDRECGFRPTYSAKAVRAFIAAHKVAS